MTAGSAALRLRRLRPRLTALFTAVNAVALIVFAWHAIDTDADQVEQRLNAELTPVTWSLLRLLSYDDNNTLITAKVSGDSLNNTCPQFAILPDASGRFSAFFSDRTCVPVDPERLGGYADDAAKSGRRLSGPTRGTGGQQVWIAVEPFRNPSGQYVGAVVAVADAGPAFAAHRRFVLWVIVGGALLVALLALAAHWLSGRVMRRVAEGLERQETVLAQTAHDLRTPVAALRLQAETARDPAQQAELLPRIVGLAAQMGGIIDSMLVRARLAAGVDELAVQPVWLDQLVAGVVEQTPTAGASVTVTAAPSLVHVDPGLVRRAIGNLLDNAVRYGRMPDEPAVVHITVAGGRVTVADQGPGLDSDFVDIMDEPVTGFRPSRGSTGLGLSIVRWVAEAHGGTLNVYNSDEGGAIFELSLPAEPARTS